MKQPGKNPGYGNRGKTNCVFPPFPQPLLLFINKMKAAEPKQSTIVYTKPLTLPIYQPHGPLKRTPTLVAKIFFDNINGQSSFGSSQRYYFPLVSSSLLQINFALV
jgi:hypothetical protein